MLSSRGLQYFSLQYILFSEKTEGDDHDGNHGYCSHFILFLVVESSRQRTEVITIETMSPISQLRKVSLCKMRSFSLSLSHEVENERETFNFKHNTSFCCHFISFSWKMFIVYFWCLKEQYCLCVDTRRSHSLDTSCVKLSDKTVEKSSIRVAWENLIRDVLHSWSQSFLWMFLLTLKLVCAVKYVSDDWCLRDSSHEVISAN